MSKPRDLSKFINDIIKYGTDNEKKDALQLLKQLEKRKAGEHFADFISAVMPEFEWNWHHKIIADRLSKLPHQFKRQCLLISVPAQTGKSELVSRKLPAWYLGVNPNARILLASYGTDFASQFNRANQTLMDSIEYKEIFPKTRLGGKGSKSRAKRTSDMFEVRDHKGYLRTTGIGAGSSGYSADLLIIDDPFPGMDEALSPTYREKVWTWFTSVGYQRLSKHAHIVILHTRWHDNDLIGRLTKKKELNIGNIEVLRFPSLADEDLHPLDKREYNEPLWPSWKGDTEDLLQKKELLGAFCFDAMEQQKPPKLGSGVIKTDCFMYHYPSTIPQQFDLVFSSWDLNVEPNELQNSDFVAGFVIGYKAPNIYILGRFHGRWTFMQTEEQMRNSVTLWNTDGLLVENKANGAAAISRLKHDISGVIPFKPQGNKITRAISCAPEIEGGNVYIPAKEPWIKEFISECNEFPKGDHDDQVDALVQAILWLRESKGKLGMKRLMDYYRSK